MQKEVIYVFRCRITEKFRHHKMPSRNSLTPHPSSHSLCGQAGKIATTMCKLRFYLIILAKTQGSSHWPGQSPVPTPAVKCEVSPTSSRCIERIGGRQKAGEDPPHPTSGQASLACWSLSPQAPGPFPAITALSKYCIIISLPGCELLKSKSCCLHATNWYCF